MHGKCGGFAAATSARSRLSRLISQRRQRATNLRPSSAQTAAHINARWPFAREHQTTAIRKPDFWKTSKLPQLVAWCTLCLKRCARVSPRPPGGGMLPWRWPRSHDFPGVGALARVTGRLTAPQKPRQHCGFFPSRAGLSSPDMALGPTVPQSILLQIIGRTARRWQAASEPCLKNFAVSMSPTESPCNSKNRYLAYLAYLRQIEAVGET